ncbi:hypothetical protein TNCV_4189411 [Trichonephila clavipes]|nr:hypothetical protein TNCV_4189411 [Trichonephila clavipes]
MSVTPLVSEDPCVEGLKHVLESITQLNTSWDKEHLANHSGTGYDDAKRVLPSKKWQKQFLPEEEFGVTEDEKRINNAAPLLSGNAPQQV